MGSCLYTMTKNRNIGGKVHLMYITLYKRKTTQIQNNIKNILMIQYAYKGTVLRGGEFVKSIEYSFTISFI